MRALSLGLPQPRAAFTGWGGVGWGCLRTAAADRQGGLAPSLTGDWASLPPAFLPGVKNGKEKINRMQKAFCDGR